MDAHEPSIDPSLLLALDALLREKSVTRAARVLGRSQPAMSNTLKRLRARLDDPLLVQIKNRLVLTERARTLVEPTAVAIAQMRRVFAPVVPFDPATTTRTFRIATSDYLEQICLPRLLVDFVAAAPGATLDVCPVGEREVVHALEDEQLDVAVGGFTRDVLPMGLHRRLLTRDRMVCVLRRGHPALGALDLQRYAGLVHIVVSRGTGPSAVDRLLVEQGLTRRIGVRLPHFQLAPALVAQSDYVLTTSERLARAAAMTASIEIVPAPLALPALRINALWHEHAQRDPAQRWFREAVRRAWGAP